MPNLLKAKLQSGAVCLNGWSQLPSASVMEQFAQAGWDSILIDLQHGLHDYASALACLQTLAAYPVTPLARPPWYEPGIIGKLLDAGAWGIVCPMTNTAADARALVKACCYPPLGERSNGPVRAGLHVGAAAYQATANQEVLILPQVETITAFENLDAILDVEGVGGIYVGPTDLGLSMGLPPTMDRDEPAILAIYEKLVEGCARRGLVAGMHCASPAYANRMIEMGFKLITVATDISLLANGAKAVVKAVKTG